MPDFLSRSFIISLLVRNDFFLIQIPPQASYKFVLYYKHRYELRSILGFVEEVYVKNKKGSFRRNYAILDEAALMLYKFVKGFIIGMTVYYIAAFTFGLFCIYIGELVLPYILPVMDASTTYGFRINSIYHLSVLVFSLNTVLFGDMICPIWIFHLLPLSKIIDNNIVHFNTLLIKRPNVAVVKQSLVNIAKMHRDFNWYIWSVLLFRVNAAIKHIYILFTFIFFNSRV